MDSDAEDGFDLYGTRALEVDDYITFDAEAEAEAEHGARRVDVEGEEEEASHKRESERRQREQQQVMSGNLFGGRDGVLSAPLAEVDFANVRRRADASGGTEAASTSSSGSRTAQARRQAAQQSKSSRGPSAHGRGGAAGRRHNGALMDSDDEDFDKQDEEADADEDIMARLPQPSNDELLYDPNIDDENELWVKEMRARATQEKVAHTRNVSGGITAAPESDAVLNCPACLTPLCLDCQRHDLYPTQFRAMFVMNCRVDRSQEVVFREKMAAKKKRKHHRERGGEPRKEDLFHPTHCAICNTLVAMQDKDEVYHFFNIVESSA